VWRVIDKKTAAILALLVLLVITGIGWFSASLRPHGRIPYDNTYKWTEFFRGYEAYLDQRIFCSVLSGSSMEPTISNGDAVLWVEVDNKAELKVGVIIIYEHPTYTGHPLVAHRIIEVEMQDGGYRFRTQGDNLSEPDRHWILDGNVQGLVIGVMYAAE